MRFVKYEEFMNLPVGTVYAHYQVGSMGVFGGWEIKRAGRSKDKEFLFSPIVSIRCQNDTDFYRKVEAGLTGQKIEVNFNDEMRDIDYDLDRMFVVLDKGEVKNLIKSLINLL